MSKGKSSIYAMPKTHDYNAHLKWTGNLGAGTAQYTGYGRDYTVAIAGKPDLTGSADPMFRGSPDLHNPEDLFLISVSSCHMLTYLALCAKHKITVVDYEDRASGTMEFTPDGGGRFTSIMLAPVVTILEADKESQAVALHDDAHRLCFIAQSTKSPIHHKPSILVAG